MKNQKTKNRELILIAVLPSVAIQHLNQQTG